MEQYDVRVGVGDALRVRLLSPPDQNGRRTALVEQELLPGGLGAPLHRHTREDEFSFVLEGELTVLEDGTVSRYGPGQAVVKTRRHWHTFWNAGADPVRFLGVFVPGRFVGYYREVAAVSRAPSSDAETRRALAAIDDRYGLLVEKDSVERLLAAHKLSAVPERTASRR